MKKIISVLIVMAICMSSVIVVNALPREREDMIVENQTHNLELVTVHVNKTETKIPAFMMNDRTYVPLRAICEALDCDVEWNSDNETATISNEMTRVKIQRNNQQMTVRDRRQTGDAGLTYVTLDATPVYARRPGEQDDNIMVPARHVAEALRAKVSWNEYRYIIYITSEYDEITNFADGYAVVGKSGKYGFVNEQGDVVVKLTYDNANLPASNGIASVSKSGKWGFVNMNGKVIVKPKYTEVKNFSNGYAAVCTRMKWGFIDESGNVSVSASYEDATSFSEGLAAVKKSGKYGFIGTSGTEIIPFEYDAAQTFSGGYAAVCKSGKWGYVDRNGNLVIEFKYDSAGSFYNEKALVQKGTETYYINTVGEIVN